jgi:hypothetical protein
MGPLARRRELEASWPPVLTADPPPSFPPSPTPLPFAQEFTSRDVRWKAEALLAMQEAAEAYLVGLFEDA